MAISSHTRGIWPVQLWAAIIGGTLTVTGPLLAIGGLLRLIRDETVLILREDGVLLNATGRRGFMSWRELVRVEIEGEALVLVGEERRWEIRERFDHADMGEIAAAIPEIQRKVLMGIPSA